uniref:Ciliary microtubule inner protein 2C n=1 Tax=Sus scrofa TaxID=9823 RepID=A0A8D0SWC1_PIG
MASRSAGTLLTEFKAAYVPPGLMPGYQGHVPGAAFSFGSTYGATTLKYFQDQRNAALEQSHHPFSKGGHFPTIFSPDPNLVLRNRSQTWDRWLHAPRYTRFNLDGGRSAELSRFYQVGPLTPPLPPPSPLFPGGSPLPPLTPPPPRPPLPTPPLSPKKKWHLLRVAPENLRTYQTFPSGKRVPPQERQRRDHYFEFRA